MSCILGCVVSVIIIQLIWERYETTPTVTMIETTSFPIWNVPFPAVTICNINKIYGPAVRKLEEKLYNKFYFIELIHKNIQLINL